MPRTATKKKVALPKIEGFVFNEEYHAYTLDGKPLHGVTTILRVINKPALIQWAANEAVRFIEENIKTCFNTAGKFVELAFAQTCLDAKFAHRKKKEAAGEAGTDVHAQIEEYIAVMIMDHDGLATEMSGYEHPQVKEFVQWAVLKKAKFLDTEKRLYSRTHWYAGTADFICVIDGKLFVGDVKTSSAIYPEHFIQASAYAHALVEMGLYKDFYGVIIVNIPKKGGLNVEENYDLDGNFECFKACITINNRLNSLNN